MKYNCNARFDKPSLIALLLSCLPWCVCVRGCNDGNRSLAQTETVEIILCFLQFVCWSYTLRIFFPMMRLVNEDRFRQGCSSHDWKSNICLDFLCTICIYYGPDHRNKSYLNVTPSLNTTQPWRTSWNFCRNFGGNPKGNSRKFCGIKGETTWMIPSRIRFEITDKINALGNLWNFHNWNYARATWHNFWRKLCMNLWRHTWIFFQK